MGAGKGLLGVEEERGWEGSRGLGGGQTRASRRILGVGWGHVVTLLTVAMAVSWL